ncbi:MAG TPA: UDP-N-acetylglucosamine 2-epimerase (non-hydrolyzing) [Gemmatimonadales bacterium]|nr:UDP-N-acetylglucosamine 2-epimerase (non-hydrolyzing) [Gemmatimonadales bacterium]
MPPYRRTVLSVVGARPNFMKLAPLVWQLERRPDVRHVIVHTGQHYDANMSDAFFTNLGIPDPDCTLGVGSGSHAVQTAAIMQRFETICTETRPDCVVVYGDVNSTLAAVLVAAKLRTPVAHVEAGLRSRDRTMPEEINRVVTDQLSDLLFTPSRDADANLRAEGIPAERIRFVGNIMIDSLDRLLPEALRANAAARRGLAAHQYVVVTLHRPSNVDDLPTLCALLQALAQVSEEVPVCFAVHPRTRVRIRNAGLELSPRLMLEDPLPYPEMLSLVHSAGVVVTDSGGLQEETSYLGVPCLTVRPNTERPVTLTLGTNRLIAPTGASVLRGVRAALDAPRPPRPVIEGWDGRTAERIAAVLCDTEIAQS